MTNFNRNKLKFNATFSQYFDDILMLEADETYESGKLWRVSAKNYSCLQQII